MNLTSRAYHWCVVGLAVITPQLVLTPIVSSQELLKAIEPGTGYSRMKQWAIEHNLFFVNFTKDSLIIAGEFQERDDQIAYAINIVSRFCAGDDYAGRAFNTTLQQTARTDTDKVPPIFQKHRVYIETLAGKPSEDGRFAGDYKVRRERQPDQKGVAVGFSSDQGGWEVGIFSRHPYLTIQVIRSKEELCK